MKKWNQQYHDKFKAFALIHKVWEQKNLEKAWKSVKANKGSAGNDGITIDQFEQNLSQNLAEIQRLLKEKRYEPSPVLRVLIPKKKQREDEETRDSYSERQSSPAGTEERT